MTKEVMKAEEVAEYLGIATSTVYKWVEHREIPFTKVGSLLRFPKWMIDQWLTRKAVRPREDLFERFVRMQQRYHIEQFLAARGLNLDLLDDNQLQLELGRAIEDLRADIEREREHVAMAKEPTDAG